jgi:Mrp family chromosome partitioning ATPase
MTTLNRALHKAYKRRADPEPAPEMKQAGPPTVSGWASKLREPLRPLKSPLVALPISESPVSELPVAEQLVPEPLGAEQADSQPPAAEAPAEPLPMSVSAVLSGGTKIRIDAGHSPTDSAVPVPPIPAIAAQPAEVPAAPVEQWAWPPIVQLLLTCPAASELCDLAVQLRHLAAEHDLRCVAFSGPGRKVGRTSLVLTLASVLIADKTTRVAIVDADFEHPDAAQLISLHPASGLVEAINDPTATASDEATTILIDGRLAIVPLTKPIASAALDNRRIGALQALLRSLRREYDLVLIDAGPNSSEPGDSGPVKSSPVKSSQGKTGPVASGKGGTTEHAPHVLECRAIDAMICVCRSNSTQDRQPQESDFCQPGVECLGVVETFVKTQPMDSRHN